MRWGNDRRTLAVHFPHLGAAPEGFRGSRDPVRGTCRCARCGTAFTHELRWPEDALFRCQVRGHTLWAWTRAHAVALRDFVASSARRRDRHAHALFLMHVPTRFLTKANRDEAVARLDALLGVERRRGARRR